MLDDHGSVPIFWTVNNIDFYFFYLFYIYIICVFLKRRIINDMIHFGVWEKLKRKECSNIRYLFGYTDYITGRSITKYIMKINKQNSSLYTYI